MRTDIVKSALLRDALRSPRPQPVDAAGRAAATGHGSEWHELALIVSAEAAVIENARALIDLLGGRLAELEHAALEQFIETAYPLVAGRPSPAALDQARRNAEVRAEFERDYEVLAAEQVHALCGSSARNRAALAARWRSERRIFGIPRQRRWLFPRFQFDEERGRPKAVIAATLAALGDAVGPWQTAVWFTSENGWLDGRRPVDLLDRDPDAVVDAARAVSDPTLY